MRLFAALALVALGCGGDVPAGRALPPISDVRFDELGGDVWSFERRLSGRAPEGCVTVEIKRGPVLLRVPVREGRFSGVVPLSPGENVVGAFCADPPEVSRDARVVYRVRLPATPRAQARLVALGDAIVVDAARSEPNAGTDLALAGYRWSADPGNPAPLRTTDDRPLEQVRGRRLELATPSRDGEYVVWLTVHDRARRRDRAGLSFLVVNGEPRDPERMREPPSWMEQAVLYGAVPLAVDDARLASLRDLGVSVIWLGAFDEARDGERVRALVERAHARGLRVLLDVEPGRTSRAHPYFEHASRYGPSSPYRALFERDGSARLALDNPDVRAWIAESLAALARDLDVDGFRVRSASRIAERAPRFFTDLREELLRIEPRATLLAEASAGALPAGFDAAFGETAVPWRDALDRGADVAAFHRALASSLGAPVLRSLDGGALARLEHVASALLFTLPGIPSLLPREGPLALTSGSERFARYRDLARVRASEPALLRGRYVPLAVEPAGVVAFARLAEGARPVVVLLSLRAERSVARVRLPSELAGRRADAILGAGPPPRLARGVLVVSLRPHDARAFAFE